MAMQVHALSIDVEDWNNAALLLLFGRVEPPTRAVVRNTRRLFDLLQASGVRATWFFLGEVAEHFPELVRMVADAGHEVGVHGYHHHLVHRLPRSAFHDAVVAAKERIEQAAGVAPTGYRAAGFSIDRSTWYALDYIAEAGFAYDSSVFPVRGPRYGVGNVPLGPFRVEVAGGRTLLEIPLAAVEVLGRRMPCGGGYMRHFPLLYTRGAMWLLERAGRPGVLYLHPYELDHGDRSKPPPADLTWQERLRWRRFRTVQCRNREQTERKLEFLVSRYRFAPIREVFEADIGAVQERTSAAAPREGVGEVW